MNNKSIFCLAGIFSAFVAVGHTQEATITVQADQVLHQVSPYLTGACLEDVNHEVYGGIYSQMIFGESFQEPAVSNPPNGFTAYDGDWNLRADVLSVDAAPGAKLIYGSESISDGGAEVDLKFSKDTGGNAGLILKVSRPGLGADAFTGYEIT